MGLFDKKDKDAEKKGKKTDFSAEKKKKADFSNVQSGSSTTAKQTGAKVGGTRTYTVKGGDSLWKISEEMYGDGNQWNRIYEANKDRIKDPDRIQPGWVLSIPSHTGTEGDRK